MKLEDVLTSFQIGMLEEANKESVVEDALWWFKTMLNPRRLDCLTEEQCLKLKKLLGSKPESALAMGERALLEGIEQIRYSQF